MAIKQDKKQKSKKTKSKNKKNIAKVLILTVAIALFIFVMYKVVSLVIVPTEMFMIENGTIYNEESAVGYLIRDEKVAEGSDSSNGIIQIKGEGEKVAKGDQIFRYASDKENEINAKIDELNGKIQEALLSQKDLFPSDIKAIESQIENKIDGINKKNDIQEISEYKKDINTYITKKSKIAGDLSGAGSYINGLIKEREDLQSSLQKGSKYVSAPIAGVVSYRVDGLEDVLTPNNFKDLNKDMLEDLNLEVGQIVTTSSENGKVINNYECYIATILDSDEAKNAEVGNRVYLRLSNQKEISATISYIEKQKDKSILIVFRTGDNVEELIEYRKITFDVIWWRYNGLKVSKSAITYDNGLSYVVRNRAGYQDKILVKILKENSNYCIVDNYDNEELKNLGYSTEDIRNMKKISIYDEIVINPEIQ